jgi:hypothetical protein
VESVTISPTHLRGGGEGTAGLHDAWVSPLPLSSALPRCPERHQKNVCFENMAVRNKDPQQALSLHHLGIDVACLAEYSPLILSLKREEDEGCTTCVRRNCHRECLR